MKLETDHGLFADPCTADDISRAITTLTDFRESYIILNQTSFPLDARYIQAALDADGQFIVEYRDGSDDEHYRAVERLSSTELDAVLRSYLHSGSARHATIEWDRVLLGSGGDEHADN